jgi:membrane-associated phospholipid phosphatase
MTVTVIRHFLQAASVILFVLVTSGSGDTNGTDAATAVSGNVTTSSTTHTVILSTVLEYLKAANFIDILPHPIRSFQLVVKEALATFRGFTLNLPQLLLHPTSFITHNFLNIVALILAVMSFLPPFILPAKVIAFLLAMLSLFMGYSDPFDKNYLSQL